MAENIKKVSTWYTYSICLVLRKRESCVLLTKIFSLSDQIYREQKKKTWPGRDNHQALLLSNSSRLFSGEWYGQSFSATIISIRTQVDAVPWPGTQISLPFLVNSRTTAALQWTGLEGGRSGHLIVGRLRRSPTGLYLYTMAAIQSKREDTGSLG